MIVAIDGEEVTNTQDIAAIMDKHQIANTVMVTYYRGHEKADNAMDSRRGARRLRIMRSQGRSRHMSKWTTADIPLEHGKLAIVTGANSGIGLHAARELARAGCTVIVACRSAEKASNTRQRIVQEIPAAMIEDGVLDLANLSSIREFAKTFLATRRPLDLLINNAGVMALPKRRLTADGFELQIGTIISDTSH